MRAFHIALHVWGIEPAPPSVAYGKAERMARAVRELGRLKVLAGRRRLEGDKAALAAIARRRARLLAMIRRMA